MERGSCIFPWVHFSTPFLRKGALSVPQPSASVILEAEEEDNVYDEKAGLLQHAAGLENVDFDAESCIEVCPNASLRFR